MADKPLPYFNVKQVSVGAGFHSRPHRAPSNIVIASSPPLAGDAAI